jgi:hypothetical protein
MGKKLNEMEFEFADNEFEGTPLGDLPGESDVDSGKRTATSPEELFEVVDDDEYDAATQRKPAEDAKGDGDEDAAESDGEPDVEAVAEDDIEVVADEGDDGGPDEDFDLSISEEEMESYSAGVQQRIRQFTRKVRGLERRAMRVEAENQEAVRIIQAQQERLMQMRELIANGEKQYVAVATAAANAQLAQARAEYRQALESGEPDKIAEANEKVAAATAQLSQLSNYRPVAPQVDATLNALSEQVKARLQAPAAESVPPADPYAMAWMAKNPWFNSRRPADVAMRNYAIEFAKRLEAEGLDPIADHKEYYAEINAEMRRRFPERFRKAQPKTVAGKPATSRPPVAGAANRAAKPTAGNKVQVPARMVRLAQKLGIPVKEYMAEYNRLYNKK